jgi:hypothetical protein
VSGPAGFRLGKSVCDVGPRGQKPRALRSQGLVQSRELLAVSSVYCLAFFRRKRNEKTRAIPTASEIGSTTDQTRPRLKQRRVFLNLFLARFIKRGVLRKCKLVVVACVLPLPEITQKAPELGKPKDDLPLV